MESRWSIGRLRKSTQVKRSISDFIAEVGRKNITFRVKKEQRRRNSTSAPCAPVPVKLAKIVRRRETAPALRPPKQIEESLNKAEIRRQNFISAPFSCDPVPAEVAKIQQRKVAVQADLRASKHVLQNKRSLNKAVFGRHNSFSAPCDLVPVPVKPPKTQRGKENTPLIPKAPKNVKESMNTAGLIHRRNSISTMCAPVPVKPAKIQQRRGTAPSALRGTKHILHNETNLFTLNKLMKRNPTTAKGIEPTRYDKNGFQEFQFRVPQLPPLKKVVHKTSPPKVGLYRCT